ncbi:MAG: hypothetical protein ACE15D_01150 [Candidatus Eisenbacteria bacterium]|nr:hypothetical protein [Candidatus Eisenbacteria bacterium]
MTKPFGRVRIRTVWILLILVLALISGFAPGAVAAAQGKGAKGKQPPATEPAPQATTDAKAKENLAEEYFRLRTANAVLRARLALSKQDIPYLILDVPQKEIRLEMQGVPLTRVPFREIEYNGASKELIADTSRIAFSEVPFVLQRDTWWEEIPLLAVKDSAAIASRADTTWTRINQVKTVPVVATLRFDRNLVVVLDGWIPPDSWWKRTRRNLDAFVRSFRSGTIENQLRQLRKEAILIELEMDPGYVRTLAPNLTADTKIVLRF